MNIVLIVLLLVIIATAVREIVVDALQKWGRNTWSRKSMLQYVDTCMAKKPVKYVDDVEN